MQVGPFELRKTLCINRNSFVGLYQHQETKQQRVLKLDSFITNSRISNHTELEIYDALVQAGVDPKYLPAFISDAFAAQLRALRFPIISLEWEGDSLVSMCLCDWTEDEKRELGHAVKNQVKTILSAFHEKGFAFVDIHAGNVVIRKIEQDEWKVKLIDLESVRPLDKCWNDNQDCQLGAKCDSGNCWQHTEPASLLQGLVNDCIPTQVSDVNTLLAMLSDHRLQ